MLIGMQPSVDWLHSRWGMHRIILEVMVFLNRSHISVFLVICKWYWKEKHKVDSGRTTLAYGHRYYGRFCLCRSTCTFFRHSDWEERTIVAGGIVMGCNSPSLFPASGRHYCAYH